MKKILVLISIFVSLNASDNISFHTQASHLLSSAFSQWPLNKSLTIAGCGLLGIYAGYKAFVSHRMTIRNHELLVESMMPYLYCYYSKNYSLDTTLKIAASTYEIIQLLPKKIAKKGLEERKNYLDKAMFVQKNKSLLAKKGLQASANPTTALFFDEKVNALVSNVKIDLYAHESRYSYIVSDINNISPLIFFKSRQFLEDCWNNDTLTAHFKSAAMCDRDGYAIRLSIVKEGGFVKVAKIFDARKNNPYEADIERTLTEDELIGINREYIKHLFVSVGGALGEPKLNIVPTKQTPIAFYAWYNPLFWLQTLRANFSL